MQEAFILETPRLWLREYTMDDLDALQAVISDPETMRFYPKPYDRAGSVRWIEWCLQSYAGNGFGLWAAVWKETGGVIGDCGISMQHIDGEDLPEIGYHVNRAYWRRGIAHEAASAVRDWGFRRLDCPALYSYMPKANLGSSAVAASIGMRKVKEYPDPRYGVSCVYRVTRAEWVPEAAE